MTEFVPGFSYPAEFNYELPTQTPPGIKQVQLRQFASSSIPPEIRANQEIQIDIPQIDFAFLDTTTTSICVRGYYTFQVKSELPVSAPTNNTSSIGEPLVLPLGLNSAGSDNTGLKYPPLSILAARPHAFLGKGWGMWYRYCVYANTNVLTDDITNIGVLQNYMDLLTTGRDYLQGDFCQNVNNPRLAGSNLLAVFPEAPASDLSRPSSSVPLTIATLTQQPDLNFGDGNFSNIDLNEQPDSSKYVVGLADCFGDYSSRQFVPIDYDMNTGILTMAFEISLPLFGTLGSGNDKLYPLFVGPTRICLFAEELDKYIVTPSNTFSVNFPQTGFVGSIDTSFDLTSPNTRLVINSCEFVGNYLRCDTTAFQYVLQNLPVEGKMIMRTTSFNYSSAQLANKASGMLELLVPTRRASQKALLVLCTNSDLADKKYGSVCPYLGQNTCVVINGVQYPQQGINFVEKPHDSFRQTLVALNLSYSALVRPAISYGNWARLSDPVSSRVVNLSTVTINNAIGNTLYPYTPRNRRIPGLLRAVNDKEFYLLKSQKYTNQANVWYSPQLFSSLVTTEPFWGPSVKKGEYDLISYTPSTQDARIPASAYTMNNNQWCHVVDTETFGRRGFLNGVSTLSGSIFYQMNIVSPVADLSHNVNFFSFFDAILVMDYTTKQISWKI